MEKVLVMKHEFDGLEGFTEVPLDKFIKFIQENTKEDAEVLVYDDMRDSDMPVSFQFISKEQNYEAQINGLIYSGDAETREEAISIIEENKTQR